MDAGANGESICPDKECDTINTVGIWREANLDLRYRKYEYQYHIMMIPVVAFLVLFHVVPMFGIVIAFQRYLPAKGIFESEWVGLKYFELMFKMSDSFRIFRNTFIIAVAKIVCNLIVPVCFALLLNEIRDVYYKRAIQTIVYIPHFLSWVVLATPIINIFAYNGVINKIIEWFGGNSILFMASNQHFRAILVGTDTWKEFGFGTIVYLAAITGISPSLYEAAEIDGATRWQKMLHVTLPEMVPIIVLMATRSLGNVLNAGFDQVFNLYSPAVYETADIIDTYVYRVGLLQMNFSLSTAIGLLKSVISMVLILSSYQLAYRLANYRIF